MDTKKTLIAGGGAAAAVLGGVLYFATQQGPAADFGHGFASHGYTATIAPGDLYFSTGEIVHGTLYPDDYTTCNGPCEVGKGRYGWPAHTKGHMMGPEGTSVDEVQRAFDKGCYPLSSLGLPTTYKVSQQDYYDTLDVDAHNGSSVYNQIAGCVRVPPEPTATPPGPTPSPTAPTVPCECVTSAGIAQPPGCQLPIHQLPLCPGPEPTPTATVPPPTPTPPVCTKLVPSPAACSLLDAILAKTPPATILVGTQRWNNAKVCNDWRKKIDAQLAHNLGPVCDAN